jgi:DNA-binding IclR family transcriptional regulator
VAGQIREPGRTTSSRVFAILDAFRGDAEALTLAQICAKTGLAKGTAHRLVVELLEWGGLERSESGAYRVGLRVFEIGMKATPRATLADLARPYLENLYEVTQENVHLAVRDGLQAVYVEKISGPRAFRLASRAGARYPLHATGMGKALLAFAPAGVFEEVVAAGLVRFTPYTITEPARLRRALAKVRAEGVAIGSQEHGLGSVSVAAPILDSDGFASAAISVVSHGSRPRRVAPTAAAVRTAAVGLTRTLQRSRPESPGQE